MFFFRSSPRRSCPRNYFNKFSDCWRLHRAHSESSLCACQAQKSEQYWCPGCSGGCVRINNLVNIFFVQIVLERNWNMWIPGFGTEELRPFKRNATTEAHKQRMAVIKKALKKYWGERCCAWTWLARPPLKYFRDNTQNMSRSYSVEILGINHSSSIKEDDNDTHNSTFLNMYLPSQTFGHLYEILCPNQCL